ncbi:MAG TPA: dTDP-glucose 4,6-dehydratase [Hyphomonadaceae bacterium]|nr:dTDP-glucose 4,6-dehydratase [Hyphomonadaceae bacterium]
MARTALVTGGAGFIGSALVRRLVKEGWRVANIDKLTYAGDLRNLAEVEGSANHKLIQADVADAHAVAAAFNEHRPELVFHLAAESHVDRSIDGPRAFIDTNVVGAYVMLDAARAYLGAGGPADFRFVHVSTDEVYGSLGAKGLFTETTAYAPNSPYAASKAAADHLARAWHQTFKLPVMISNCSNNYGPYQNAEKLIPTVIGCALLGKPIPVYGDGRQVRDWLYVEDHVDALLAVARRGAAGEKYNIGGHNEVANIDLVKTVCRELDARRPKSSGGYADQIAFVTDRPGHDRRYAIDATKAMREIGWSPKETFATGIARTVDWYCANEAYWREAAGAAKRLGLADAKPKG